MIAARALPASSTSPTPPQQESSYASCQPQQHDRRGLLLGVLSAGGALLTASTPLAAGAKPPSVIDVLRSNKPGERDVLTTSTGIKFAEVSSGTGDLAKSGDLVLVDLVGRLDGGKVFLDTRALGAPLAFQVGTTNRYVPEGLSQIVEGMTRGSQRLAVLPASLGFGEKGATMPGGTTVPPNSDLYYEIELLRCENFTLGLVCCSEAVFVGNKGDGSPGSCIKKPSSSAGEASP